jgi:hypothetical protein
MVKNDAVVRHLPEPRAAYPAPPGDSFDTPGPTIGAMGFNPFREQRRTTVDVVLVVVFLVITAALVAWGFLG